MASTEEQKKAILPFLQRADEVNTVDPKVAYYCRMYAIEQGLALENRSPPIDGVLGALLAKLEKDKPSINIGEDDKLHCENFAVRVFTRADKADRAGRADKNTATTYYAASIFIEIMRQFGELSPDLIDMQRYAAWKAADIRKALREGRQPTAGNPAGAASAEQELLDDLGLPSVPGGLAGSQAGGQSGVPDEHVLPSSGAEGADSDHATTQPFDIPGAKVMPVPGSKGGTAAREGPRYRPGSKVYYSATGAPGVKGTVAKVVSEGGEAEYMVALQQTIVQASELQMAPEFEPGQRVEFHNADGQIQDASVVQIDASHWRPTYTITCDGGEQQEVPDEALEGLREPKSPMMPDATPPSIAAPSPSDGTPMEDDTPPGRAAPPSPRPPTHSFHTQPNPQAPFAASRPTAMPGGGGGGIGVGSSHGPVGSQPAIPTPADGFKPGLSAVTEAHKLTKFAASSLGFEDIPAAVKYLTDALKLLTQPT
ncbi:hypothetical protein CVIRNUC_001939 [Coccomyxa viridis]|uniref:Vacuolar protein sorting-associated protein VTA1 n=1 Tax=Coccomyxa viridis TaxID=1274662 RepID=A0AAV1HYZ4_9CHLO|nr:hypothetical protein CVIRNUC_001939 [Coccomyxa viridis]